MAKYRPHRTLLEDAMKEVKEFESKEELLEFLREDLYWCRKPDTINNETVTIEKYGDGIDERIGWDTHIIVLEDFGVLGFTDGMLT